MPGSFMNSTMAITSSEAYKDNMCVFPDYLKGLMEDYAH